MRAQLLVGEASHADAEDHQGEDVEAVTAQETVEEAVGDVVVALGEGRQRDVVKNLVGQAAEEEHASQGDDEAGDAHVGDPEALERTDQDAHDEGGDDTHPPGVALLDDEDATECAGHGHD